MRRLLIFMMVLGGLCFADTVSAQVHVSVNIGSQPSWGPSGYDYARYYYIPDMDAYYDVSNHVYIYMSGGRWIRTSYVPAQYSNVDLYRVHKVVINDREPWRYHDKYRASYGGYRGRYDQVSWREYHHDNGNHNGWYRGRGNDHDNGNHNGWDRGRGNDHDRGHDNGNHRDEDHGHGHGRH